MACQADAGTPGALRTCRQSAVLPLQLRAKRNFVVLRGMQVTEAMRRDIFNKNEQIVELQNTLAEKQASFDVQLRTTVGALEQRLSEHEAASKRSEEMLRSEVASLTKELSDLEAFTQAKEDLERSQLNMRAENDALKAKLDKAEQEEERRYVYGTMTLKREYEQKMEELKKRCVFDAALA